MDPLAGLGDDDSEESSGSEGSDAEAEEAGGSGKAAAQPAAKKQKQTLTLEDLKAHGYQVGGSAADIKTQQNAMHQNSRLVLSRGAADCCTRACSNSPPSPSPALIHPQRCTRTHLPALSPAQGGPSVLFVPDKPEGEQNWAWGSGTDHKKDEAEEESWEERQANREAATEKAEESGVHLGMHLIHTPSGPFARLYAMCLLGWEERQANREAVTEKAEESGVCMWTGQSCGCAHIEAVN